jgi:hypothetical protein
MGGQEQTYMGLSGFGDLMLSCASAQSRNFGYGMALGRGEDLAGSDWLAAALSAPPEAQPPSQPTFDNAFSGSFGAESTPAAFGSDSPHSAFGTGTSVSAFSADSSFAAFDAQPPFSASGVAPFEARFGDNANVAGDLSGIEPHPESISLFETAFGAAWAAGDGVSSGGGTQEGMPPDTGAAAIGAPPPMSPGFDDFSGGETAGWQGSTATAAAHAADTQSGTPPAGAPSQGFQVVAAGRSRESRVDSRGHSLLVAEVVSAQLEGRKAVEYKVRLARRAGTKSSESDT